MQSPEGTAVPPAPESVPTRSEVLSHGEVLQPQLAQQAEGQNPAPAIVAPDGTTQRGPSLQVLQPELVQMAGIGDPANPLSTLGMELMKKKRKEQEARDKEADEKRQDLIAQQAAKKVQNVVNLQQPAPLPQQQNNSPQDNFQEAA